MSMCNMRIECGILIGHFPYDDADDDGVQPPSTLHFIFTTLNNSS